MKLQAENLRLSDQIAENNLKNNQKAAILARDVSTVLRSFFCCVPALLSVVLTFLV